MIRIELDEITKREIEQRVLEDAKSAPTGLFRVLKDPKIELKLRTYYPKLYKGLYDLVTKEPVEEKVARLLTADRQGLEQYISEFGEYDPNIKQKRKESDYLLEHVFRYATYANRKVVPTILQKMDVPVCPYCNRQFTFTLAGSGVRPQLDHFFPKRRYPYLALSLYNMVPSCSICNMAKSSKNIFKDPILYPFDEELGYDAQFKIHIDTTGNFVQVMQGQSDQFELQLDYASHPKPVAIKNQWEILHLKELYSEHRGYVMDILKAKYVNTPKRISEIRRMFPQLFHSDWEVKSMMYMTDIRKESWGKRPLAKLTHDIDQYMEQGAI